MARQLLKEYQELRCSERGCADMLNEQEKSLVQQGFMLFPAKLQEADSKNGNGRVYPRKILEREVQKYQALIADNSAVGELSHPDNSEIDPNNISHKIVRMFWQGNDVLGIVQVLKGHPKGTMLEALYNNNVKFGFSSRALGSLKENVNGTGPDIVQEDLDLICFDAVINPSAPGAYVLRESQQTKEKRLETLFESIIRTKTR